MTKTIHNQEVDSSSGAKDPTAELAIGKQEKKTHRFFIHGKLPSMNAYTKANRTNWRVGAAMKKETEQCIVLEIRNQLRALKITTPVFIHYTWIETNRHRDKDNIASAKKFVQDALVKAMVLENDGWKNISGFSDAFKVDAKKPGVLVELIEVRG